MIYDKKADAIMKRMICFEIRRALTEKSFYAALLVGLMICMADLALFYSQYGTGGDRILIQAWIGTDFQFAYNSLYYVLFPVIACLPYAGTLYADISLGYDKNIVTRAARNTYITAKCIAVFLSAFLGVTIPLLTDVFIAAGIYPNHPPEKLTFLSAGIIDCNLFPVLFNTRPALYILAFILIDGLFAGLMGLVSLAVSKWTKSFFTSIVFPFVLYVITGVIFTGYEGDNYSVMEIINPSQRLLVLPHVMVGIYVIVFVLSIIVLRAWTGKRDVL